MCFVVAHLDIPIVNDVSLLFVSGFYFHVYLSYLRGFRSDNVVKYFRAVLELFPT